MMEEFDDDWPILNKFIEIEYFKRLYLLMRGRISFLRMKFEIINKIFKIYKLVIFK